MSGTDSLDQLVADLLEGRFVATVASGESCRTAAERDERDRARYATLTGRHLPMPREIQIALGFARVAADYRRRYGVPRVSD